MDVQDINPLALPSIPMENRSQLPLIPAVYFAIGADNTIFYIGKADCLKIRWQAHHRFEQLSNDTNVRIAWLEMSDTSILMKVERECIKHFQPKYNRRKVRPDRFEITKSPDIYGEHEDIGVLKPQYDTLSEAVNAARDADNYEDIFLVWKFRRDKKSSDTIAFIFQGETFYKKGWF